jgi:hypothetical protein
MSYRVRSYHTRLCTDILLSRLSILYISLQLSLLSLYLQTSKHITTPTTINSSLLHFLLPLRTHDLTPLLEHMRKQHIEPRNICCQYAVQSVAVERVEFRGGFDGLVDEVGFGSYAEGVEDEESVVSV